jgi:hypothetical protein
MYQVNALQTAPFAGLDETVLETYRRMHDRFEATRELPLTGLSFAFPRQARWSLPFSSRQGYPATLLSGVLPTD